MCVTRYNPDECKQSWGCDASRVTLFPRPNPPPAATTAEQVEFPSEDQEKEESDEKGRGARAGKGRGLEIATFHFLLALPWRPSRGIDSWI